MSYSVLRGRGTKSTAHFNVRPLPFSSSPETFPILRMAVKRILCTDPSRKGSSVSFRPYARVGFCLLVPLIEDFILTPTTCDPLMFRHAKNPYVNSQKALPGLPHAPAQSPIPHFPVNPPEVHSYVSLLTPQDASSFFYLHQTQEIIIIVVHRHVTDYGRLLSYSAVALLFQGT